MKGRRNKVMGIGNIRGGEQLLYRKIINFINRNTSLTVTSNVRNRRRNK